MPLHLLGKKSWNVYNADNIARVRRDEAEARAREEADEQRMQEADAARRLAILRGEIPPPLEPDVPSEDALPGPSRSRDGGAPRKRKRAGEDDTDFEMRVAREQQTALVPTPPKELPTNTAVSLTDSKGHISLFPEPSSGPITKAERNPEAEREKARKERDLKDQYQMRFVNAGGSKEALGAGKAGPWYAAGGGTVGTGDAMPSKDVWGNEDPKRKEREVARLGASDPLAMMKRGAAKVREIGKERNREAGEREREMKEMEREEKERKREENRRRRSEHGRREGSEHRRHRRREEDADRSERRGHEQREEMRRDEDGDRSDRRRNKDHEERRHREDDGRSHRRRHREEEDGRPSKDRDERPETGRNEDSGHRHRAHGSESRDRRRRSHRSEDDDTHRHKRHHHERNSDH